MSRFDSLPTQVQRLQGAVDALAARMGIAVDGSGLVRQVGGGGTAVGVPEIHEHTGTGEGGKIARRGLTFHYPDEDLAAGVFIPRPSYRILDKFMAPTAEASQRFTVTAGTVGSGVNSDVVLESSTNRADWTIRATVALDAQVEDEVDGTFVDDWVWNPSTDYLRVRCTLMDAGTAPKDVSAIFDWS